MQSAELQNLIQLLAKLPGLGPRSGRRAALHLVKNKQTLMHSLMSSLKDVYDKLLSCSTCGNLDTSDPCGICTDPRREKASLCVIESVADLWALERTSSFKGKYHILGGVLSIQQGNTPDRLTIQSLVNRVSSEKPQEVILALSATPEGVTTTHYLLDALKPYPVTITGIAHGVPIGGELDYLDDGTIYAALKERRPYTF
jgi:recombination protein RecR